MITDTQYAIVNHNGNIYALKRDSYRVHAKLIDGPAYSAIQNNDKITNDEKLTRLSWECVFEYKHSDLDFLAFPAMAADWK